VEKIPIEAVAADASDVLHVANVEAVPIVVENWLPDHPGQTADQKRAEVDARKILSSPERSREGER
jgi:hypothetical protein